MAVDRLDLGFVDMLSREGSLDHPLSGPQEELYWRRAVVASTEPPRSRFPVVDADGGGERGGGIRHQAAGLELDGHAVAAVLDQIGLGPNGKPWDCGACGFATCRRFAEAATLGRATLKQCMPYQERRADVAQQQAAVDQLTGLSTYRVLRDRLAFEVERSKRSADAFAVLFLDLDRFKQVNDQFGHEAGNDVLRAVAGEIRQAVRASDIAARYGGDEFVVILTRTDLEGAGAGGGGVAGRDRGGGAPAGVSAGAGDGERGGGGVRPAPADRRRPAGIGRSGALSGQNGRT